MATREEIEKLVEDYGEPYSELLDIDLKKGDPAYFRWFLAAFLFAKPIREETAMETYRVLDKNGLTSPQAIENAGWYELVELLGEGGYAHYDESTATRLLDICKNLLAQYDGKLSRLYDESKDSSDLEQRIRDLGKGIGPVTIAVFLRDMQEVWPKASQQPVPDVRRAAADLGIEDVKKYAREHGIDIVRLETALHRYAREMKRHHVMEAHA
jgi:endonuclease III